MKKNVIFYKISVKINIFFQILIKTIKNNNINLNSYLDKHHFYMIGKLIKDGKLIKEQKNHFQ